jgi:hypothetical protein
LHGGTVVNAGFALFAFDALLLVWVATYTDIEARIKNHLQSVRRLVWKIHSKAAEQHKVDLIVQDLEQISGALFSFQEYYRDPKRYSARRWVWILGVVDVVAFMLYSVVRDCNRASELGHQWAEGGCLMIAGTLLVLHIVWSVVIFRRWRKSKKKVTEISRAKSRLHDLTMLIGLGAIVDPNDGPEAD